MCREGLKLNEAFQLRTKRKMAYISVSFSLERCRDESG